jgi:hypothetical protein
VMRILSLESATPVTVGDKIGNKISWWEGFLSGGVVSIPVIKFAMGYYSVV